MDDDAHIFLGIDFNLHAFNLLWMALPHLFICFILCDVHNLKIKR